MTDKKQPQESVEPIKMANNTLSLSPEAALFKMRWEQECQNSLLLLLEIKKMNMALHAAQMNAKGDDDGSINLTA